MLLLLECLVLTVSVLGAGQCLAQHTVTSLPYPASYVERSNETRFLVGSSNLSFVVPRTIIGVRPAFVYHTRDTEVATLGLLSDPVAYRGVAPTYALTDSVDLPPFPVGWR